MIAKRFLLLNGIAIINVVLNHSIGWAFVAMFWWVHRYSPMSSPNFSQIYSPSYFILRFLEQWIIPSIPAFLMVSGYIVAFSAGKQKKVEWNFVLSRIKYLVIPYLFWSILMIIYNILQGERYSPIQLGRIFLTGQATEAYYFVPLLVTLYALSPFLIRLVNWNWKITLWLSAIIQIAIKAVDYPVTLGIQTTLNHFFSLLNSGWFFAGHIFWFLFGIVLGIRVQETKNYLKKIRWPLLLIAGILFLLGMVEWEFLLVQSGQQWLSPHETLVDNLFSACILFSFIGFIDLKLPLEKHLENLGTKTYGIYLSHSIILIIVARIIYHFLPQLLIVPVFFCIVLLGFGLAIPLILMGITRNSILKSIYPYIFG
ncbi:MAG: acyltransferase family protein [Chloroflexota bacterium]